MKFKKASPLKGEVHIPGDKSISHRSVMFGSIAKGTTQISHFLQGADCLSTISCFQKMGVRHRPRQCAARLKKAGYRSGLRQQRHHHPPDIRNPVGTEF